MAAGLGAVILAKGALACSLALVLALDVSASVDPDEFALQQKGLGAALRSDAVAQAIVAQGGIWLTAYEWSGKRHQYEQFPWTFLDTESAVLEAANAIAGTRRLAEDFPTSLGFALSHGLGLLRDAPEACTRRVIDVSSDGESNDGFSPATAYKEWDVDGITVNALVIEEPRSDIASYYRERVIHGPGAFVEVADGFEDYERAMRRKLLREIGVMAFAQVRR